MPKVLLALFLICWALTGLADQPHLYTLVSDRLDLMDEVAAFKWINRIPVEDLKREAVVLEKARSDSLKAGIGIKASEEFFAQQILAAKEIQAYWFAQWDRTGGPVTAPDLRNEIRPQLIELGNAITRALGLDVSHDRDSFFAALDVEGLSDRSRADLYTTLSRIKPYPDRLIQIKESGILRVGTTGDYAPFSHRQNSDSPFVGIDITLAQDLADSLGAEVRFVHTTWPGLIEDLKENHFDIAMSGVSRSLVRQQAGYFSVPYHTGGKTPISLCNKVAQFDTISKIDVPSTRIIVNPGGTNERFVDSSLHQVEKILHLDNRTIFDEIIQGRADVMITDSIEVRLQANRHPQLCATMPGKTLTFQEKGYLMPSDIRWKTYVDLWLATRIGDGTVAKAFTDNLD